uniref:DUF3677 domain-containing protein n=2 Tax=Macrostomum lignano TaxID=282301 RepID=A0A1I8GQ87_9PLAT
WKLRYAAATFAVLFFETGSGLSSPEESSPYAVLFTFALSFCWMQFSFNGGVSSKPLFLLLDACFGMKHKVTANSGHSVQAEAGYFITPDIESNVTAADDSCANWRAGRGESLLSASQHRLYDVFGLFSGICRHGSVVMLEDLVTPGEKLNYAKSMVHNFLSGLPSSCKAIISYDVACKLSSHFHQDERLRFAVPAFHAYGHTAACQLKSGIRATEGAGLTDGEAVERFWSELRPITKQTKEMTKRNRQDFLNFVCSSRNLALVFKIGLWLIERQRLQAKTLRYLEGASGDATKIDDEAERILEIYEANQAASRQRTRDKEATIKFLHVQACDREFLSRYLLTSRGQKMAAHLRNMETRLFGVKATSSMVFLSKMDFLVTIGLESPAPSQQRLSALLPLPSRWSQLSSSATRQFRMSFKPRLLNTLRICLVQASCRDSW